MPEFPGFWAAAADGRIRAFGDVPSAGDLAGRQLGGPIVSLAATPAGRGYWMVGADGGVFAFGDAPFPRRAGRAAPLAGRPPRADAHRARATGSSPPPARSSPSATPPSGASCSRCRCTPSGWRPTPSGQGYWIATADAQVFAFGDAVLQAATGASPAGRRQPEGAPPKPTGPTVAIAASPDGKGYWLLGRDGGVFSFGVPFHGSVADRHPYGKAVDLRPTESGAGYYVAGTDGAVFAFGDADRRRERAAGGAEAIVDVAFRPTGARPRPRARPGRLRLPPAASGSPPPGPRPPPGPPAAPRHRRPAPKPAMI